MKKIKLPFLYCASLCASVLPVLIYFLVNYDKYISTAPQKFKLLFGGLLAVGILIAKTIGAFKINSGIVFFGFAFVFSYLLESIVSDLLVFSFLALVGEILAMIVRAFIKREKAKQTEQRQEEAIERAILKSSGRV
ncbi:MAG: hypothetical protein E7602_04965 [Ruminococcaceae bacterium]|nr:hypothetical protein [Oscillospiraceae bacterium]